MSQAGYREQAHHSASTSLQKSKNTVAQVEPPCILICCIPVLCISMGVCLSVRRAGQNLKGFSPETSNTGRFPFARSEREVAIQKLSRQMTVELSHPVIWESLPRLVPPRDSQTGQHAPTCLSRTSCRLPQCQWAPVKVIACRDGLYGSHLEMWYSYCFQAHI